MAKRKTKKRMGRPPLPPAEVKSEIVRIRVTKAELRKLNQAAKAKGASVAELLIAPWRQSEGD